nr:MAG TPA: hypothetical protein [Bacteriophage sp.]
MSEFSEISHSWFIHTLTPKLIITIPFRPSKNNPHFAQ